MMRHFHLTLAVGAALSALMFSCTTEFESPEVDITSVRCSISQIDVEEDFATGFLDTLFSTKATFSGSNFLWSEGDKIGIIPTKGSQIYFAVDNGAGTSTASFNGGDWAMKSTGTFYAYYPLYPDIFLSKDHVPVSYTGQTQSGNNNNLHTGDYWTLYTEGTPATGNTLNFSFNHLTSFFKTYVTVPAGTYTKIAFSAPSEVFIKEGYFDLGAQVPAIVGTSFTDELSLDLQNVTFTEDTELTGYLVVAPIDITGIPITVTVYKDGEAAYEYTLTKTSPMVAAKTYAFRATALTQVVSSVSQANALFASGEKSVTITDPLTEDATVILPNTEDAVTLTLPTTSSTSTLTVSYAQDATAYPATLSITGPEGSNLDIYAPNSTVTVNGVSYNQITSRTAANTCIIPAGVSVNILKVVQGGVEVYGTVSQIDLSEQEDDAVIYALGTVTTLLGEDDEEYIPATGVSVSPTSINLTVGATETLTATVTPVGAYPNVVWSSSDKAVATVSATGVVTAVAEGSATITATTVSGGFTDYCDIAVTTATVDGYEYVDLGLSVLWAAHNIGASKPEEVGSRFVWAYTSPSDDSSYYNYKYSVYDEGYEDSFLTKYCCRSDDGVIDNLRVLLPEDDAAYNNWGNHWRMPKEQEFDELLTKCSWSKTSTGYIVTGTNGNSIFLPIKETRDDGSYYSPRHGGNYWSSSLSEDNEVSSWNAVVLDLQNYSLTHNSRVFAYYIRPVCASTNSVSSVTLDKTSLSLTIGDNGYLNATVLPSNVTNNTITWTSSDSSIASVSRDGVVTAKSAGMVTILAECEGKSATCTVTVKEIDVTDISLSETTVNLNISVTQTTTITLNLSPSNAINNLITWTSSDPSVATVTAGKALHAGQLKAVGIVTAKSIGTTVITAECGGKSAACDVTVIDSGTHGFVDLGLSVKWATCNVGANNPEEYGDYYAWGETITKSDYSWSTYKWCNGDESSFTKYNSISWIGIVDNITILDAEDDVAHVKFGGSWRMPTREEVHELMDTSNCTWEWTTINGIYGYKVISKIAGFTDNWIFLPIGGYRGPAQLFESDWGDYWTSEVGDDSKFALCVSFYQYHFGGHQIERHVGLAVRPVFK